MLEQLAQYKILDRIGAGGMGVVYRARDTRLGRTIAIKVLPQSLAGDDDRRARFLREAQAAAALSHPNIAALYEIGEDQGHLFLAFEFVPGETLRTTIAGRPLHPRRAIHFASQIADALADAHARGIIHRDVKPDNIVITPKGHAKVLDFGLAKWTASGAAREAAADRTTMIDMAAADVFGTVAYMSPEQALGEALDARTDIFSLGVVLWEMLVGSPPFRGATPTALALQIVQAHPPAPSAANKTVPPELDPVVAKMLAKSPPDRYESAAMLAADLRAVDAALESRSESAHKTSAPIVVGPRRSRGRWVGLAAAVVIASAVLWYERAAVSRLWRTTIASAPPPVVAVIPLEIAGADASHTYFADGLTEDLITRLGQTAGLKVLGRSATRDYRGRSPRDLARELGAGVVLTGTVRPAGEAVKISLELIDPGDSTDLWTGQYTRDVKDIFAVQAQIAEDVARALRLTLQPTAASARTASRLVDQRAYDAYLRGRQAAANRDIPAAKRFFAEAIRIDDGLAEAHAGLAEALHLESVFLGAADSPERRADLKRAADRAYELDPDLPQANLAAGLAAERLADALGFLKKAISGDSTFSEGFHQIGDQIRDFDPARAIRFYRRALALDPHMDVNHADIVSALSALGRYDEAQRELEGTAGPAATWKTPLRLALALDQRQYELALAALRAGLINEAPIFRLSYINTLRMAERRDEALREARDLVRRQPGMCEARAALAGLLYERRQAAAARTLAAPAIAAAGSRDVDPAALRCGALSAAAAGDVAAASALVNRIAADERLLRFWAIEITGATGAKLLRREMFPWNHVYNEPAFVEARAALDRAYSGARQQIAGILDDVTP